MILYIPHHDLKLCLLCGRRFISKCCYWLLGMSVENIPQLHQVLYGSPFVFFLVLLKRKHIKQQPVDLRLPWNIIGEYLIRRGCIQNRIDIILIKQAVFRCKKRRKKQNIGYDHAAFWFKAMDYLGINKQTGIGTNWKIFRSDQYRHSPTLHIHKFQFCMPMPVNTVKVKLPHILIIKCKRVFCTAMTYGFSIIFISLYECILSVCIHCASPFTI